MGKYWNDYRPYAITGIPLPFLSYGGTFQLINLVCIGIALSVAVHKEGLNF
ncbi:hypothetical protein CULT_110062 [[Clostridium] ultunense Esp]|uniref:Uncharacterized protein n=1 Tax=[Clostridium] ultunense Esp TaxID=1288971 RepID=M1Z5K7_9FIRM|nr:hypothetical protein CULT_110062 [[Clostridium] ultunense Esp]SHD75838.1 conserved protein of unknown function [[Clostridium] ultunense Esp]